MNTRWTAQILLCVWCVWACSWGWAQADTAETADCILAVVNDQAITLSDIRILEAFGLFRWDVAAPAAEGRLAILERAIDQKIVIDLAREPVPISEDRLTQALNDVAEGMPPGEFTRKLAEFGLAAEDLKPFLEERILFQAILDLRFGRAVSVTLKEIEDYYRQTYVPAQQRLGAQPVPLLQVVTEIEAVLKKDKTTRQVESWVGNLKKQAIVERKDDCLKDLRGTR